jgi:hypothetical protein
VRRESRCGAWNLFLQARIWVQLGCSNVSERGYSSLDEVVLAGDAAELRDENPKTRKASIIAVLAGEEPAS